MSRRSLTRGWHFGATARSAKIGRFLLTETNYPGDLQTPLHAHEAPAFSLVLAGSYLQRFGSREVVYQPSRVLFRPADAEHTDRIAPQGATCFIVEPGPTWLAESGLARLNRAHTLDQVGARATWLAQHALAEFRNPDVTSPVAIEGLMLAIAAEFARLPEPKSAGQAPPWLRRAREALDAGPIGGISLTDLAADAGVHPVYLAAAFRASFGTSVARHVRNRRIAAARQALLGSSTAISAIAHQLGFSSQSHFTRVFREETGFTPLQYRRLRPSAFNPAKTLVT